MVVGLAEHNILREASLTLIQHALSAALSWKHCLMGMPASSPVGRPTIEAHKAAFEARGWVAAALSQPLASHPNPGTRNGVALAFS